MKNHICNAKINLALLVKVMWYMSFLCVISKYAELVLINGGIKTMKEKTEQCGPLIRVLCAR